MVGQPRAADNRRRLEGLGERAGQRGRARGRDRIPVGLELGQEYISVGEIPQEGNPEQRPHGQMSEQELERRAAADVAELMLDGRLALVGIKGVEQRARQHDPRAQQAGAERALPARAKYPDLRITGNQERVAVVACGERDDRKCTDRALLAPDRAQRVHKRHTRGDRSHRQQDERRRKRAQLDCEPYARADEPGAHRCKASSTPRAGLGQPNQKRSRSGTGQREKRAEDEVGALAHFLVRAARSFARRSASRDCMRSSMRAIAICP